MPAFEAVTSTVIVQVAPAATVIAPACTLESPAPSALPPASWTVGEPQLLRFALLPTAWRFAAGSRIRLSVAGGDGDHFVQTPHGRPPLLKVLSGGEQATLLELPVG